jgi:hypothetical protein
VNEYGALWNILTGACPSNGREICLGATLSSTNSTWNELDWNPGLRGEGSKTGRLRFGREEYLVCSNFRWAAKHYLCDCLRKLINTF